MCCIDLSLIWFSVWSSLVHGAIMAIQSLAHPEHVGHLLGDVPALLLVAVVLAFLIPRGEKVTGQAAHAVEERKWKS